MFPSFLKKKLINLPILSSQLKQSNLSIKDEFNLDTNIDSKISSNNNSTTLTSIKLHYYKFLF